MLASLVLVVFAASSDCLAADAARIQSHLLMVEAELRAKPTPKLPEAQREARARNLDHLHSYATRGVFPKNDRFAAPTPFFIDAAGTRCAMAALIEAEGGAALVRRVAHARNNAFVRELVDDPALVAWLEANGMTADEAARVQPAYSGCSARRVNAICHERDEAAQFLITRLDDGGIYGTAEKTHGGDAGLMLGAEHFVTRSSDVTPFESEFVVGRRVFAQLNEGVIDRTSPMDADGGIGFAFDRRCAVRPSVGWDAAIQLYRRPYLECVTELLKLDPAWGRDFCGSYTGVYDYCFPDGGYDPRFSPGFDGGPPPLVDAGAPDAGVLPGSPPAGCGCGSASGVVSIGWLLAALGFARRRVRHAN